jgi:hypothetical protein
MEDVMTTHIRKPAYFMLGVVAVLMLLGGMCQAAKAHKAQPHAKITVSQAEAVALKKFPGKIAEKSKLENEEGVWQYGVMVRSGKTLREIMVNAKTGKIDSVEVTTSAKEKVEARADAAKEKAKTAAAKTRKATKTAPKK